MNMIKQLLCISMLISIFLHSHINGMAYLQELSKRIQGSTWAAPLIAVSTIMTGPLIFTLSQLYKQKKAGEEYKRQSQQENEPLAAYSDQRWAQDLMNHYNPNFNPKNLSSESKKLDDSIYYLFKVKQVNNTDIFLKQEKYKKRLFRTIDWWNIPVGESIYESKINNNQWNAIKEFIKNKKGQFPTALSDQWQTL